MDIDFLAALRCVTVAIKEWVNEHLNTINVKIDDIMDMIYQPIKIEDFYNNVKVAELGSTVSKIKFDWLLNKTPVNQMIGNISINVEDRSYTMDIDPPINGDKTFYLNVTDEREASHSKSTSVIFANRIYYGVLNSDAVIDNAAIRGLSKSKLQRVKTVTFTDTAGDGKRFAYALPSNGYGTPTFTVNGFNGGFYKLEKPINVTNSSQYTELYDVWLSVEDGLGELTIYVT